jgi:hypothetical protein
MTALARRRRRGLDIWPGFVDALATLVMVIVFVLMIFTLFQFHLKDVISGRDQALAELSARIGRLADELAMEKRSAADLRDQLGPAQRRARRLARHPRAAAAGGRRQREPRPPGRGTARRRVQVDRRRTRRRSTSSCASSTRCAGTSRR